MTEVDVPRTVSGSGAGGGGADSSPAHARGVEHTTRVEHAPDVERTTVDTGTARGSAGPVPAPPAARPLPARRLQPPLHELLTALRAPTAALSGPDGQIREAGAQGLLHADVRVLSAAVLTVNGAEPELVAAAARSASSVWCTALCRQAGDEGPDPTIRVDRERHVSAGAMTESIVLRSTARKGESLRIQVRLAADLAPVEEVKAGLVRSPVELRLEPPETSGQQGVLAWSGGGITASVQAPGAAVRLTPGGARLDWEVLLPTHATVSLSWAVRVTDPGSAVVGGGPEPLWPPLRVWADDRRLPELLQQGMADLDALRMATSARPGWEFFGAGAPWYFTLFGRDSIWAARLLLPLGTGPALGTLRTLAGLQGVSRDSLTAEAPGKILHEVRRARVEVPGNRSAAGRLTLPPVYYGTVDATPLWVLLLHDAWRYGLPPADVEPLLDNLERALAWLTDDGDPDGDGFLEYIDEAGRGLVNQGWKDSDDSVRFADGSRARPSIALCEVQGYAVAAALAGADLLDAFGRPGAGGWRDYATALTRRFRESFWVADPDGDYPAIALDGDKRRVDTVTSNIGHLLGTGILDDAETAAVVRRLTAPDMDSGFGLRTMSSRERAYSPLSYHCGSVWAHDTAIVLSGISRAGHGAAGAGLAEGLLAAGTAFGGRLPELFGGDARAAQRFGQPAPAAGSESSALEAAVREAGVPVPVPYPASCRPQAWSAAAAVGVLSFVLGLRVDVPAGLVTLSPLRPSPVGALRVSGLASGSHRFDVEIDAGGQVLSATLESVAATGLRLVVA